MNIEIKKLELTNYRAIEHAVFEFDGNSKIVGENKIGKTTILESIVWLLTDKLLNGSSDIQAIKPINNSKAEVRVEGTFQVGDKVVTIRKEYGEDWVKTRGTTDLVFKGHYLNYYYNDVKQKTLRDFNALFNEDFGTSTQYKGIELVRLLTDPFYLGDLGEGKGWVDLRAFIISITGDVSDNDVVNKDETLKPILKDLEIRSGRVDEIKKFYSGSIETLKEQIIGDDAQIKMLEETPTPNKEDVEFAKASLLKIDEEIAKLQSDSSDNSLIVDIEKQCLEINNRMLEIKQESMKANDYSEFQEKLDSLNNEYHLLLEHKARVSQSKFEIECKLPVLRESIEKCAKIRAEVIESLRDLDASANKPFNAVCPTCHRELEGESLANAKAEWEHQIQSKRDLLVSKGKDNKKARDQFELYLDERTRELEKVSDEYNQINNQLAGLSNQIKDASDELKKAKESNGEPTLPHEYYELSDKLQELTIERAKAMSNKSAVDALIREKVADKLAKKEPFQKVIDDMNYASRSAAQLEVIRKHKVVHAKELASFEQKKELLNKFMKVKLGMLDDKVASIFGNIKFQLIKENINGGYDQICKPYIYNVDLETSTNVSWRNGSKSERVTTGVAIAEKIKAALGLSNLPFLFDEGGEISTDTFNNKFKTESQLICVKVVDNIRSPMVMKI